MMTLEELAKKREQEALALQEAIEHAEQKAVDENDSCGYDHKQLAKWLKELQEFRKERKTLEEPFGKEYRYLSNDLEELAYLADGLAFSTHCIEGSRLDVPVEHRFIWRSVREIAFRALRTFKRAKYFEKKECDCND